MSPHRNPKKRSSSPRTGLGYQRDHQLTTSPQLGSNLRQSVERLGVSAQYARTRISDLLLAHGWRFLFFSLLMRLPAAMVMLAVMMMLAVQNNEATLGGYAAGTVGLSAALMVPIYRSISERLGQRRIFFALTVLNILALIWLMIESLRFAETSSGSISRFLTACAVTGVTTVPLGAMMRSYWSARYLTTQDRRQLNASISLETMFDVIALPAGAVIAGMTTVFLTAQSALFAVMVLDMLGLIMLLWRPENLPVETRDVSEGNRRKPLRGVSRSLLWIPQLGTICLGLSLGSTQAAIVAYAISTDQVGLTGFLIALLGLCAVISALFVLFERLPMFRWGAWLVSGSGLTLTAMTLSLPTSALGMILPLVGVGLAYGICLVTMDSVATSLSVRKNLDLALSTLQACFLGGVAVGFVWAGDVSGSYSYQAALIIPLVAAAVYFCLGHLYGFLWRRTYEERLALLP
ncbi:MAG: MFS transporter [Rothia sp. (in: high G+C Gram-positive bacteria)]|nr:MFS transporter [Rothia sp. (in: high G+C Gram-positive bacteria)]